MKFLKKILPLIFGLIMFLAPISIDIDLSSNVSIGNDLITLNLNQAHAINLNCSTGFFGASEIGCQLSEGLLSFYELIIFYFTQILVVIIGVMLDIFIFLSIDSQFYRSGLIETGWEILRDFTNIIFIFALLVTAFKMVLGQDDAQNKSTLVKTIIIALTINFSLFMTFLVIDASNLLAHTMYNKIDANSNAYNVQENTIGNVGDENGDTTGEESGADQSSLSALAKSIIPKDAKNLSIAIAGKINPQKIVSSSGSGALQAFIIITGAGVLNILLAWLFLSMILLFVGRAVGLVISAILAPVAFASLVVPGLQSTPYIGFKKWFPELISLSFLAPVYMFFLYLVITFLGNDGFLAAIAKNPGDGILSNILTTYIPFMIIGALLFLAKNVSKSMAGELGGMAIKGVQGVTGTLVAGAALAATGGLAGAGSLTSGAGRAASAVGKGAQALGVKKPWADKLIIGGDKARRIGRVAMSTKIDPTKSRIFKAVAGDKTSAAIGKVTGKSILSHLDGTKNFKESEKKRRENAKKWQERISNAKDIKDSFKKDGLKVGLKETVKEFSGYNNIKKEDKKEYEKNLKENENDELKSAGDIANQARRKAEAKFETEISQKQEHLEKAIKERNSNAEFIDKEGNKGGYIEAQKQVETESKNINELTEQIKKLKNDGININYSGSDIDKNNAAATKKAELESIKNKISMSEGFKNSAEGFIKNISKEVESKKEEFNNVRSAQKAAGDKEEKISRLESASKASTGEVAEKIIGNKKAKGKSLTIEQIEKALEKNENGEL